MGQAPIYDGNHAGATIMSAVQQVGTDNRYQATDGKNSFYYDTNGNPIEATEINLYGKPKKFIKLGLDK